MDEIRVLLQAVRQEDEVAFADLAERYQALLEAEVKRFLPSFDKNDGEYGADDLKQYAAVALYRAAVTYEPDEKGKGSDVSFGLYAKICIRRALISVLRKYRSAKRKEERRRVASATVTAKSSDPLEKLVASESAKNLRVKIREELSPYEKEIFDSYIVGKSVHEIAAGLGKKEKSVSNALYRVKAKVKGLLKNQ